MTEQPQAPQPEITTEGSILIELERNPVTGKTIFKFKVMPQITEIFKAQAESIKLSEAWVGLSFYAVPQVLNSNDYCELLSRFRLFDDYGHSLIRESGGDRPRLNIAWLRTVGGEGSIEVFNHLGFAEVNEMVKNATRFIKDYFEDFFRGYKITGEVRVKL